MSKKIEASEVFDKLMRLLVSEDFTGINDLKTVLSEKINSDPRPLSEMAIWILEKRGFDPLLIPKMQQV